MSSLRCSVSVAGMLLCAAAICLPTSGCGDRVQITKNAPPVQVSGTVLVAGKSISDVHLAFQPTGAGMPAGFKLDNGKFSGSIVPGTYTYFVASPSSPKGAEALKAVPEKLREGSLDRQIDISGPSTSLELKLE